MPRYINFFTDEFYIMHFSINFTFLNPAEREHKIKNLKAAARLNILVATILYQLKILYLLSKVHLLFIYCSYLSLLPIIDLCKVLKPLSINKKYLNCIYDLIKNCKKFNYNMDKIMINIGTSMEY